MILPVSVSIDETITFAFCQFLTATDISKF
nr:MAG TPA: hypothetical protein [Caudoviricetes sp.]